jgi:hypothetical protein
MATPRVRLSDIEDEKEIDVMCPTCRKTRRVTMFWTGGNVLPRIRCESCKLMINKRNIEVFIYDEISIP